MGTPVFQETSSEHTDICVSQNFHVMKYYYFFPQPLKTEKTFLARSLNQNRGRQDLGCGHSPLPPELYNKHPPLPWARQRQQAAPAVRTKEQNPAAAEICNK